MKTLLVAFIGWVVLAIKHFPLKDLLTNKTNEIYSSYEAPLLKTHWKLIELSGEIIPANATPKEMYFVLKTDNSVFGNGGCNSFSGKYSLGKSHQISFGEMIRTNILCPGIDFERRYMNALAKADHYSIIGDTLSLQNNFLSLAKFVGEK